MDYKDAAIAHAKKSDCPVLMDLAINSPLKYFEVVSAIERADLKRALETIASQRRAATACNPKLAAVWPHKTGEMN